MWSPQCVLPGWISSFLSHYALILNCVPISLSFLRFYIFSVCSFSAFCGFLPVHHFTQKAVSSPACFPVLSCLLFSSDGDTSQIAPLVMSLQLCIPKAGLVPVLFADTVTIQDPPVWMEAFNEHSSVLKIRFLNATCQQFISPKTLC